MAIVKINALEIPPGSGEEIVKRFSARLDELSRVNGFEGFELLRLTGDAEPRWFVYTRWVDEDSYQAWRNSDVFARGHAQPGGTTGGAPGGGGHTGGGHPGGHGHPGDGHAGGHGAGEAPKGPVSMGATLLEFEVAVAAGPSSQRASSADRGGSL